MTMQIESAFSKIVLNVWSRAYQNQVGDDANLGVEVFAKSMQKKKD